jgi:hypothetical protein
MTAGVAGEIDRRLAAARVPASPNEFSAAALREWAVEYLRHYDDELARFPQLVGRPHWSLWMMDAERDDALFAVLAFRSDGVGFFCGTGDSFAVRQWSGNAPGAPAGLKVEAAREFRVTEGGLWLSREAAEEWLGRSW